MNFVYNPSFQSFKKELLYIISNFDTSGTTVGNGKRNTIKKIVLRDTILNIKSFKQPNLINTIVYQYFRKSKARRSFEYANALVKKGIGTPTPIAYAEYKKGLGLGKSFYISAHVEANLTYRELVQDPNFPAHEEILRAFTRFTFQLHENDIEFLDHSPGNTLIFLKEDKIDFAIVDLNRMNFKSLNFVERMYNFRRLTPKKEMVAVMSDEYAQLINKPVEEVFELMWKFTREFQRKFHLKQRRKKFLKSLF